MATTAKRPKRDLFNKFILTKGALLLTACGSDSNRQDDSSIEVTNIRLLTEAEVSNGVPLQASNASSTTNKFLTIETDPYWTKSLEMENYYLLSQYFKTQPNKIYYAFPLEMPSYLESIQDTMEWQPVPSAVMTTTETILKKISDIIDIEFAPTNEIDKPFVISVMSNNQGSTEAYSYFPSTLFSEGSDIFLNHDRLNPKLLAHNKTNYDYEIIVHEIGHALGLKHPFAPLGDNKYVLPQFEDNSSLTAMTYTENEAFFNGELRVFDYLTLVGIYGINPNYNNTNNKYEFTASGPTFIIDAGGRDVIDASAYSEDVFVDLRENGHSYVGVKHQYISAPFQLAISENSVIEDTQTGSGNDHIVGNNSDNHIIANAGDDVIYPGEGRDLVEPGKGQNQVNLYELVLENDFIIFDTEISEQKTEIYNFNVTGVCDVLVFDCDIKPSVRISPIMKFTGSGDFGSYDIFFYTDFNSSWAHDLITSSTKTDKLFITDVTNDGVFDTEIYMFDASSTSNEELLHIASIDSNGANLADWSEANFLLI